MVVCPTFQLHHWISLLTSPRLELGFGTWTDGLGLDSYLSNMIVNAHHPKEYHLGILRLI